MKMITIQEFADYLETANVETSNDFGHAIVHTGVSAFGFRFVLMNNMHGESVLTESM